MQTNNVFLTNLHLMIILLPSYNEKIQGVVNISSIRTN